MATTIGNMTAAIYHKILFHFTEELILLLCFHTAKKQTTKKTSGTNENQNISQTILPWLLPATPMEVSTTRSKMTPIEIATPASIAFHGESVNGVWSTTCNHEPHSGQRLRSGLLSWYPQDGQGPLYSFKKAAMVDFLRLTIDIVWFRFKKESLHEHNNLKNSCPSNSRFKG